MSNLWTFIKGRISSIGYALKGLADLFKNHPNAQVHLFAGLLAILLGFILHINTIEWCILAIVIGAVISAEAFNSALEYLTDLSSPDYHPLAGKAKDIAAAAVIIMAFTSLIVGLLIFLPKIINLF